MLIRVEVDAGGRNLWRKELAVSAKRALRVGAWQNFPLRIWRHRLTSELRADEFQTLKDSFFARGLQMT